MVKKLIFMVYFTFWIAPKVSAQQDFLNATRITSVIYDFSYDFNYIFRHYLTEDISVSFMDSITIYKWDSLQKNYSATKRLRFKYTDARKCYSVEVIDLTTNSVTKKAIIEILGRRSIQLHLYKSSYSTSNPY